MRIIPVFLVQWPVLPCHCKKPPNKHSVLAPGSDTALVPGPTERTAPTHKLWSLLSLTTLEDAPWLIKQSVEVPQPHVLLGMILQCLKHSLDVLDLLKCSRLAFSQKREAVRGVNELKFHKPNRDPWVLCLSSCGSPLMKVSSCAKRSQAHIWHLHISSNHIWHKLPRKYLACLAVSWCYVWMHLSKPCFSTWCCVFDASAEDVYRRAENGLHKNNGVLCFKSQRNLDLELGSPNG